MDYIKEHFTYEDIKGQSSKYHTFLFTYKFYTLQL